MPFKLFYLLLRQGFLLLLYFHVSLLYAAQTHLGLTAREQAWIQTHPQITVGGSPDWTPFNFVSDDGRYSGIANDYLNLIAQKTGLKFKVEIDQWNRNLQKIKDHKIDLLPAVYYTKERSQYLIYSPSYFEVLDYFFIRNDLDVSTFSDLNGKRVAIPKAYAHIELLRKHFPKIKIITVDTFGSAIDAVLEKRADMLYDTYGSVIYTLEKEGINTIIPFKSTRHLGMNPIHIVTRKDKPELARIIKKGLNAITAEEKRKIFDKWLGQFPAEKIVGHDVNLTQEEQQWIKTHPVVKYGAEKDWAPYDFVDSQSHHVGLTRDYLDLIGQLLSLQFKPVIDDWNVLLDKIKLQQLDLLPAIYFSQQRLEYFNFTQSYTSSLEYFFIRNDIAAENLHDISGKTLAIPKGYLNISIVKQHFPSLRILEVENLSAAIDSVIEKKADLLLDSYSVINYQLQKAGISTIRPLKALRPAGNRKLFMAVPKNNHILAGIINKALSAIPEETKQSLHQKWLGYQPEQSNGRIHLSKAEQQWLERHPKIRFTGNPNWLPYEAFDKQGQYIGIVAEYLELIEKKLGIQFNMIRTQTWKQSIDKVKRGAIDVLSETSNSDLQSFLSFTEPYLSSPIVIIMKKDQDYVEGIKQIKHTKIALIKDYGYVPEITKKYPNLKVHFVNNIQEGLTAVSTEKVDALLATLAQASYQISELSINNIRIVGKTEFTTKLAFAMRQGFSPLIPLFNRALQSISPIEKQNILDKWGKQKFAERADYRWLAKVIGILLLFMIFMSFWIRRLAKEMRLRKEAEIQTKTVIDSIPLQIIITTKAGKILSANPQALHDYQVQEQELDRFNISEFYADINDRERVLKEIAEKGKVEQLIVASKQFDGRLCSMMISIKPIKFQRQNAFLTIAVDMTERLEMEAALQVAIKNAQSANRAKSEFLANMSHEIRTPMNAIIGFTELLNEQLKDPKLKSFVNTIQSAGNNLLVIINDILDLSKIEAGKLQIEKKSFNLHHLFVELGDIFVLKMQQKNIDFILDIDPEIPQNLYLDATRLRQVLFNLIGNAVKFTDHGFIKVNARYENEIHSKLDLVIDVEDSGMGIAAEQQKLIFQDFEQSSGQNLKKYGGTGLGLSISKRLVKMMGGALSLKSRLGYGSSFTIKLTDVEIGSLLIDLEAEQTMPKTRIEFEPAKILVVDDVQDNLNLLLAHFEGTAIKTMTASHGQQAVELVRQTYFDLILMDIRMPVMNGYQAAEEIKSFSDIPIVALTASVMTDDFERKKSECFDGYLRKPVLKAHLVSELCKFLAFSERPLTELSAQAVTLTAADKTSLSIFLSATAQLASLYETCIKSNSMSEIKHFSDELLSLAKQYPLSLVSEYTAQLHQAVESFDIAAIKHALTCYPELIAQLKTMLSET